MVIIPLFFFLMGKVSTILSPRTMESMDIYEEIIREEQEEKEATYNEVCWEEHVLLTLLIWLFLKVMKLTIFYLFKFDNLSFITVKAKI